MDTTVGGTRHSQVSLALMMALTFVTGLVDAVGYLALDRVFVGNMTGNVVILGMGIAGADHLPVVGPLVAFCTFFAGAALAGLVMRDRSAGWGRNTTALLILGAVTLAGVAVALRVAGNHLLPWLSTTAAAAIAMAMGVQAAVARRLAIKDLTTVVVTSTLTSLASESLLSGGLNAVWNRRTAAIVMILAGALSGALLLRWFLSLPIAIAALLTLVVAVTGHTVLRPIDIAPRQSGPRSNDLQLRH